MWFSEANEFIDIFKSLVPYYLLIALPLMIVISPVNPVSAAHEFPAYRMQQFDLHGVPHGCRASSVNLEGRGLLNWSTTRHCVIAHLQDLSIEQFREIRSRAGALLVILPKDLNKLTSGERELLVFLESNMLQQETFIPVYFSHWSTEIDSILNDIQTSISMTSPQESAAEVLLNQIGANGYQVVVGSSASTPRTDVDISSIHAKLYGRGRYEKYPFFIIVAHYDSFGVAPDLAMGANSNGAAVAMLLEIARVMSVLYDDKKTSPRYNIVFLLSGGGKMNFQGSKKWIEDNFAPAESEILPEASYVLCLDSVGSENLYYHVSKPPKENSVGDRFMRRLNATAKEEEPSTSIELVHKKINLAEEMLAWEHERFSMKRVAAATLSSLKNHRDANKNTILDTKENLDMSIVARNTRIVAEAIAKHIFDLSSGQIFSPQLGIKEDSLQMWMEYLSSQPRSPQLLAYNGHHLVRTLGVALKKSVVDIKVTHMIPDKRDPEVIFYDNTKAQVNIHNIKPAVFDLILTVAIIMYLSVVFLVIQKFSIFYNIGLSVVGAKKSKYL